MLAAMIFRRLLSKLAVLHFVASAALALASLLPALAFAETDSEQAERAQQISRRTLSPFCPGRTLSDCPSPYATEWRRDIREMVAKGMTNEQIRAELKTRTPKDLSGEPSTVLDSVLPVVVTVGAIIVLVILLRTLLRRNEPEGAAATKRKANAASTDDDSNRFSEEELDQRLKSELDRLEGDSLDD